MIAKHALSVLAFVCVSFAVQGLSHFVINAEHFAAIAFMRSDPILPLGIAVMLFQGLLATLALSVWRPNGAQVTDGVKLAALLGAFLVSYIALVEPSKYAVPSIPAWLLVELSAGAAQFLLFGLLLGMIHNRLDQPAEAALR